MANENPLEAFRAVSTSKLLLFFPPNGQRNGILKADSSRSSWATKPEPVVIISEVKGSLRSGSNAYGSDRLLLGQQGSEGFFEF